MCYLITKKKMFKVCNIRETKYSYDFNFEVIGVFLCRKIKNFFFYPVFSLSNLSLYEGK